MEFSFIISHSGHHLFTTAKQPLLAKQKAMMLFTLFMEKFPATEGYTVQFKRHHTYAEPLNYAEFMSEVNK